MDNEMRIVNNTEKRIIECSESKAGRSAEFINKKSNLPPPHHTTEGGCRANTSSSGINNSHKMGSRRIFTPQFKLQVLESYRSDNDCKGNQRATARKYNIHRRQIQKWLQCESSLRSSVANINQNTVKHQFHNISMHQQQQQQQPQNTSIPTSSLISVQYMGTNQHPHQTLDVKLSDAPHNAMIVPPPPPMSTGVTTSSTQTQGVFSVANLAAVVAAASGAMTITNSTRPSVSSDSIASPLRQPSIISASSNATPLLHHHHHHYGIAPPYLHTPANVPLSVPMLTHHISHPQHIHHHHQAYRYHNLAYTQALTHQSDQHQSSLLSSTSLPASLSTGNGYLVGVTERTDSVESLNNTATVSESAMENNNSKPSSDHKNAYEINDFKNRSAVEKSFCQFKEEGPPVLYPGPGPMDLSLRSRRHFEAECLPLVKNMDTAQKKLANKNSSVVDLTHRKRKVSSTSSNSDVYSGSFSEKCLKLKTSADDSKYSTNSNYDEDEIEIEVGTEEKFLPSKPIKLFKPYLLDEDPDTDNSTISSSRSIDIKYEDSSENNPRISYTTRVSPPPLSNYDASVSACQANTFQSSSIDNVRNGSDGFSFSSESIAENAKSAFALIPTISPSNFRCPKGSPASSGYESSSSTFSESSFSSRGESYPFGRTYSINLHMQAIHHDSINLHPSKHVENWLEQEARSHSESHNSPIAILA